MTADERHGLADVVALANPRCLDESAMRDSPSNKNESCLIRGCGRF